MRNDKEKYRQNIRLSLAKIYGLQDAIDLHKDNPSVIVISERAIIIGDSIFNMYTC